MLLQPTTAKPPLNLRSHGQNQAPLASNSLYSLSFPSGFCSSASVKPIRASKGAAVTCKVSQVHSYGTVDYEKRPVVRWNLVYKKILDVEDQEKGVSAVVNKWENEGKPLTKWELSRVVRELRKFKRFKPALQVYEWMSNRAERFRQTTSDTAIQLDLIAKVRGIPSAEEYFENLPDTLKDKRIYGSLLNAYVRARMRKEAESMMDELKIRGYASIALPYNVIMTLYLNAKEYDKVEAVISEMLEKRIQLDVYSYNIWMSSCGGQDSLEKLEQVHEKMQLDTAVNPNWTTYSTMATLYIKLGEMEKAYDCLKKVEGRLTGRDRIPYHYLISLYGTIGKKDQVYRVWKVYKSLFTNIPNLGYHALVSSLIRLGDIEGAEKIYQEWFSAKTMFDPRIGNLLLGYYVRNNSDKVEAFFNEMVNVGGKVNPTTWEILAEGHIRDREISKALFCLKSAAKSEGSKSWRPKADNVCKILKYCEEENDAASKEALMGILKKLRCLEDDTYMSYVSNVQQRDHKSVDNEGSEMLFNQLQESL